jgi:preprotein translocase subunit SecD
VFAESCLVNILARSVPTSKDAADKLTSEKHQGKPLAIMVDGKVIAAPVVRSQHQAEVTEWRL